jgi:cytochrome oxidase Cu insertion factor (SCO1/SenC/PrrC family)
MLRRRPGITSLLIVALAALMLGIAALAGAVLGGGGGAGRSADADVKTERFRGNAPSADFDAADFALRDALSGELVRMSDQRGRVVVLTLLESRCTAACPLIASQVGEALRRLPAEDRRDVVALAVSANPRDDSRGSVRTFLTRHRALGEIRYLNRPEAELRRVWKEYRVLSALESGDADTHSAPVRIYSRSGRWLATQHAGVDLSAANLVHDISLALLDER